jgi:hypothetical protein
MLSPSHEHKPEPPLKPGQRPAYRGCRYSQFPCSRAQTAALSGKCEHSDVIKIEQSAHVYSLYQFASRTDISRKSLRYLEIGGYEMPNRLSGLPTHKDRLQ